MRAGGPRSQAMKKAFVFRFVPKPLRLIRCAAAPGRAPARKPAAAGGDETVRYVPALFGTQLLPLPVVFNNRERPKRGDEFYDED